MPTPSIDKSVHVISGASAASSLKQSWGRDFIILRDPLCPGPCNVNPIRHRQQRETYLLGYLDGLARRHRKLHAQYLRSISQDILNAPELVVGLAAFPPAKPVLLWTAPTWHDRLSFWWMLDAVNRSRQYLDRFWIAELVVPSWEKMDNEIPVTALEQNQVRPLCDAGVTLRPLDPELLRVGTALWGAFAGRSAAVFDETRRQGRRHFADILRVTHGYSCLVPQVAGRKVVRLRLSEFDQALLDALRADAWQRPLDVLRNNPRLIDYFVYYGDQFLLRRLREWGQHRRRRPAVLTRPESPGVNEFTANAFQLTQLGIRLRDEGLQSPGDAPLMFIGGCRLYGTHPTWVRRNRGEQWWIERLEG